MKRTIAIAFCAQIAFFSELSHAWNTGGYLVNWIQYEKNGVIEFTLYDSGDSGSSFQCNAAGNVRLRIEPCGSAGAECVAAVNRMATTLLTSKVSGKPVHIQNNVCAVTQVAISNE